MEPIRYEAPHELSAAIKLLDSVEGAYVLAGGTDLLIQLRSGVIRPTLLVDLKRIPELTAVSLEAEGLSLGAAVACAELREHKQVEHLFPGVYESAELIGSEQIQGRASLGGNLCNASPAADTVPALLATGARCVIAGPAGSRTLPCEKFVTAPGETALARGELLVSIQIPRPAPGTADCYLRMIPRTEMDIAVVGAAVSVTLDASGNCTNARVAQGAVGPTARLVPAAAAALVGGIPEADRLEAAAHAASAATRPIDDKRGTVRYRRKVTGVLTRRAAEIAIERARQRNG
ncbi:MAG: xanthine dehydrogenase family protein subunit M [Myxococcota bacterium]|nr:xanthine dehydrogenase family protein subunit M [Myxococcota bacterium]